MENEQENDTHSMDDLSSLFIKWMSFESLDCIQKEPNKIENDEENASLDDLSMQFPRWRYFRALDQALSNLRTALEEGPRDLYKQSVLDAFKCITSLLKQFDIEAKEKLVSTLPELAALKALQTQVDHLETEVVNLNPLRSETQQEKITAPVDLTSEAFTSLKELQHGMEDVRRRLDVEKKQLDDNRFCLESLFEVLKDFDSRKVDLRQLDREVKVIMEECRTDGKVDVEEFRAELKRLDEVMAAMDAKLDASRKSQMLQCEVTDKIFEMLPSNMLKEGESHFISDRQLNVALEKLEDKVMKVLQENPTFAPVSVTGGHGETTYIVCSNVVRKPGQSACGGSTPFVKKRNFQKYPAASSNITRVKRATKPTIPKRYVYKVPPYVSAIARQYLSPETCSSVSNDFKRL